MNPTARGANETVRQLVELLPELGLALYESVPHADAGRDARGEPLTARQAQAVMFLAHHGPATMGEFAHGLETGRAAATELVARLIDKGVVRRQAARGDRRKIVVALAGPAERYAEQTQDRWRSQVEAAFERFPAIDPDELVAFLRALIAQLRGGAE